MQWTEDALTHLTTLRTLHHLSTSQCAALLNTTKGAVVGALYRQIRSGIPPTMKLEIIPGTSSFQIISGEQVLWAAHGFATRAYRDRAINIAFTSLRNDPPALPKSALLTPNCAAILREYVKRHWRD